FAAIVTNYDNLQFPFFIVDFEREGFEIHKDNIVVVTETVYELNHILTLAYSLLEEKLPNEAVKSRDCDTKYTPLTKRL
ncbi:6088_t:CDS:2, partial [Dentiscutata erythropus]